MTSSNTLRHVRLDLGYELRTWDTGRTINNGKTRLGFELLNPLCESRVLDVGRRSPKVREVSVRPSFESETSLTFLER